MAKKYIIEYPTAPKSKLTRLSDPMSLRGARAQAGEVASYFGRACIFEAGSRVKRLECYDKKGRKQKRRVRRHRRST